jgi:hypothetical protein
LKCKQDGVLDKNMMWIMSGNIIFEARISSEIPTAA